MKCSTLFNCYLKKIWCMYIIYPRISLKWIYKTLHVPNLKDLVFITLSVSNMLKRIYEVIISQEDPNEVNLYRNVNTK